MPFIKFDIKDYPAYLAELGRGRLFEAARRGAYSAALRSITLMHKRTDEAPPANPNSKGSGGAFNTGRYKQSWKASPAKDGAYIFNSAPYAGVIEYGRRAGARRPPIDPIARWAQRRLGLKREDAKAAAVAIAYAIAKRGLKARKVLTDGVTQVKELASQEINAEFGKELTRP